MRGGFTTPEIVLVNCSLASGRPGKVSWVMKPSLLNPAIPYSFIFEAYWNCTCQKMAKYSYASIAHRCIRLSELVCAIFWVHIRLDIIIQTWAYWGTFSIWISSDVVASATTGSRTLFFFIAVLQDVVLLAVGYSTYNYTVSNMLAFVNWI